jgi:hypothetical protein
MLIPADFSTDFAVDFANPASTHDVNPDLVDAITQRSASRISITESARVTSELIYLNFRRALLDMNMLLGAFSDNSTIPVSLLNEKHVNENAVVVCFSCLARDINKTIAYIKANNL